MAQIPAILYIDRTTSTLIQTPEPDASTAPGLTHRLSVQNTDIAEHQRRHVARIRDQLQRKGFPLEKQNAFLKSLKLI